MLGALTSMRDEAEMQLCRPRSDSSEKPCCGVRIFRIVAHIAEKRMVRSAQLMRTAAHENAKCAQDRRSKSRGCVVISVSLN